jgi:hypothetical protein
MSRPIHAACRASLEPMGWVLQVSRAAPHRCCVRSPSKLCTYAGRRQTGDSHLGPDHGPRITYGRRSRLPHSPKPFSLPTLTL